MATTYCVRADVESIMGLAGVLAHVDDDQDGTEASNEDDHITNAIERAAVEMNSSLRNQYDLADLTDNDWCKWCNAYLASMFLYNRRGNPAPMSILEVVTDY